MGVFAILGLKQQMEDAIIENDANLHFAELDPHPAEMAKALWLILVAICSGRAQSAIKRSIEQES